MSARMQLDKGSVERAILYALLGGALILSPMGGKFVIALAQYYLKKWWDEGGPYIPPENDPAQVRQSIYKLKRNDYINWKYNKSKNIVTLDLTPKGRKLFEHIKFADVSILPPRDWDRQWRFLLFDIPEKSRNLRNTLRDKVKSMGFFQFQKSVWIYPLECENEIRYICEFLGATAFTMMFTAKIENDKILRRYFVKQGVLPRKYLDLKKRYII